VGKAVPLVGLAIRLTAATIWCVAGAAKLDELDRFQAQVAAYKLLPRAVDAPFAYTLPFVELGLGLYLAVGLLIRPAALVGCALMIMFVVAQAQAWARGLSLDCGCFGSLAHEQVGPASVLRDAALGLPSLALAVWPARLVSLDRRVFGLPDRFRLATPSP
jgi:uncharacterized membrane protein YphA (DoxX/SURF4 family)